MDKPDYSIAKHVGVGVLVVALVCFVALIAAVVS